uniref:Uncharacterized protein n=1 Tax=Sphaerodactylus townsendi TaxID=933632 RepID=A0ACB8EWL1_9SAUR
MKENSGSPLLAYERRCFRQSFRPLFSFGRLVYEPIVQDPVRTTGDEKGGTWESPAGCGVIHWSRERRCLISSAPPGPFLCSWTRCDSKFTGKEIEILRQVSGHPYIITLIDSYESSTFMFLVFDLMRRGELFF